MNHFSTRGINLAPVTATYFPLFRLLSICIASDLTVFITRGMEHQNIKTDILYNVIERCISSTRWIGNY